MTILDPDTLHIDWRFTYRGCKVEIDRRDEDGFTVYVAWVHHDKGCAIAATGAPTKAIAIRRAKDWVNTYC